VHPVKAAAVNPPMSTRACGPQPPSAGPGTYLRVLSLAFAFFNGLRTVAYLPNIWAIHTSGQSDQHSLFTWLTLTGANATMAAWVHESNGGRFDRVVLVSISNATMCLMTVIMIAWYRW